MESPLAAPEPLIILNPVSGFGQKGPDQRRLRRILKEEGLPTEWIETRPDYDADQILRENEGEGPVVVIGGDGTLQAASRVLAGSERPLVIVPAGSGNVMALRVGIPMGLRAALRLAREGVPRRFDLGRSGHEPFLLAMGAGFEGHLIRAADRELKKVLGKSAYALAAARNLVVDHHAFEIEVDGVTHEAQAASVMVANFGTQVGTWIFPPQTEGQDGLLDVAILRAQNLEQLVTLIMASFGAPITPKGGLTMLQGKEIRVRCEHKVPVQRDGDDQGDLSSFDARIDPASLRVLVPRKPRPLAWPPRIEWP